MIVWGGLSNLGHLNTGGRYNPLTDSWTTSNTANAPAGREFHTAVWTGNEMIVWGGYSYDGVEHYWNTGGRYNPNTDSWSVTSTTNVPSGRQDHAAVWTGSEMIVWGGYVFDGDANYLDTGGRYNPVTDTWIPTANFNAPVGRDVPSGIWTGSKMIIWGGYGQSGYLNSGGSYSPGTDTWTSVSITGAPSPRAGHVAVWTGSEMIIWGGIFLYYDYHYLNTGGRYDPQMNSWVTTSTASVPAARTVAEAVWTGSNMIVWGGQVAIGTATATGGKYCAEGGPTHPAFFSDEVSLGNGVYYLQFPNGTPFGYYAYLTDQRFVYHFDMGYEYWFDANDGHSGIFFYDFMSGHFLYTSPSFPFPYLYDFSLNTVLYSSPDPSRPRHYTTNPRYFYNFATHQIITM